MISTSAPGAAPPSAPTVADTLREACGGELVSLLAFGSRVSGASPDPRSAWDLFVVVDSYREFYRRCRDALGWRLSSRSLAFLNRILPPNVLRLNEAGGPGAKLFVITEADLTRRLFGGTPDHFCRARLLQRVDVAHARDDAARFRMEQLLTENRHAAVEWMRPFLDGAFDVETFCRELICVSYRTEVRPESAGRAEEVFGAQKDELVQRFEPVLQAAVSSRTIIREGSDYRYPAPAGTADRARARLRMGGSKARSTARWIKHLLTFDGWLDYIVAKVERRVDVKVDLSPQERRFPLLLLWPKFIRVLRARRSDR